MANLKSKQLSNPFSTGGGGHHFESQVQASFLALMLSGGRAPHLPEGGITSIKLQGKVDGYEVDDFIITTKNQRTGETEKLLGQVKHSVAITAKDTTFREVIFAAWSDYNNEKLFRQEVDKIAMVTGPLSKTDQTGLKSILQQARCTSNHEEFFRNIERGNFVSQNARDKITILRNVLSEANSNVALTDKDVYGFLRHFYWIGYDLGTEEGVVQSLLLSHIVQFKVDNPLWLWGRLLNITQTRNQSSGTLTLENLPNDVRDAFSPTNLVQIPKELNQLHGEPPVSMNFEQITSHPDAGYLAKLLLLGSWNETNESDKQFIAQFLDLNYSEWQKKAQAIVTMKNSPLSLDKNGIWSIKKKKELWKILAIHLFDSDIDKVYELFLPIITEKNSALLLLGEERMFAMMDEKQFTYSSILRNGLCEGLAILANNVSDCKHCSQGKISNIINRLLSAIFDKADWLRWASLDYLLPMLAEASPKIFLSAVERSLYKNKTVFQDLFAQETGGIAGNNFFVNILWALESLAWAKEHFIRVCVSLAGLASIDPGGQSGNRPFESLREILLPWYPQTLAPMSKQQVAIKNLFQENPEIAWKLLLALLPRDSQISSQIYRPKYFLEIDQEYRPRITSDEYSKQILFYVQLALENLNSLTRYSDLLPLLQRFTPELFEDFISRLEKQSLEKYTQDEIEHFGEFGRKFIKRNRRYADKDWTLSEERIILLEKIVQKIAPTSESSNDKDLFSFDDYDYLDGEKSYSDYIKKSDKKRLQTTQKIFNQDGIAGILKFAKTIQQPYLLGISLSCLSDTVIEKSIIPALLSREDYAHLEMIKAFVFNRFRSNGWDWVKNFSFDTWNNEQRLLFFLSLPFIEEVWREIEVKFSYIEKEYWKAVSVSYERNMDLDFAIEKLLFFKRPHSAIKCLNFILYDTQEINHALCRQALIDTLTIVEDNYIAQEYEIECLIKELQTRLDENFEALCKIEFAYIKLFRFDDTLKPVALITHVAQSPAFFCEIIQTVYVAQGDKHKKNISEHEKITVDNAWNLLQVYNSIPGVLSDGNINSDMLNSWIMEVKSICEQSGHLDIALDRIGKIFSHAPCDPSGLWIHKAVAKILNMPDAEIMRNAFEIEKWNSRGVRWVDKTGQEDRNLAEQYRKKADDAENEGFHRLAGTVRSIADDYEKNAELILERYEENSE